MALMKEKISKPWVDQLNGLGGDDKLYGSYDRDTLMEVGNDLLFGEQGNDSLKGGVE